MNLPNKITTFRIILIPIFMLLYALNIPSIFAGIVFLIAAISDFFDGYLARKYHLVTNFGKIMDPLADKLLVTAALLYMIAKGIVAPWMVMIILAREFLITGLRVVAASNGTVIAAAKLGKLKTVVQLIAVLVGIFFGNILLTQILMILAVILTVASGTEYMIKNIDTFQSNI